MRSEKKNLDPNKAYERALYLGCGYSYEDLAKPRIAIVIYGMKLIPDIFI